MMLVVDANMVIAALIKEGKAREILKSSKFKFVTSDFVKEEIQKYSEVIIEKSGLTKESLDLLEAIIFKEIETIPKGSYEAKLHKAEEIMKNDVKDATYVACYLALKCDGIWTHDPHFYGKPELKIFRTSNLLKLLQ